MKTLRRISIRLLLTIAIAAVAAGAALTAQWSPTPDQGMRLEYRDGQVYVASVEYGSLAQTAGLQAGQVITWLDAQYVLGATDEAKREIARSRGPWTTVSTVAPELAADDLAAYARLSVEARGSSMPWLSDPAHYAAVTCFDYWCDSPIWQKGTDSGGALPPAFGTGDLEGAWTVAAVGKGWIVCSVTYSSRTFSDGSGQVTLYYPSEGGLCVASPDAKNVPFSYGYVGPLDYQYLVPWYFAPDPSPIILGVAILILGWLVVGRGWAGAALKPYTLTLPVATAVPLLVMPIDRYPAELALVTGAVLVPLAMLPLAIDFLARIEGKRRRWIVAAVAVALAVASVVAGLRIPVDPSVSLWRVVAASGVAFVPGLFAARPLHRREPGSSVGSSEWRAMLERGVRALPGSALARLSRRIGSRPTAGSEQTPRALVESVEVLLAAMTPGIAALSLYPSSVQLWPILAWLGLLLIATRLIVRPLARVATAARRQRDLVVAATEAERLRIAADIHDEALQDLTMLVRRLDAAGDKANADAARDIADRLRAICGDLRLPMLDDLGVGPALEWLCGRLGKATDSIVLDRLPDETRLPADVELAVFRIAQEALSNAIRHGTPPIVVRYRSGTDRAELEVEDRGSGIPDDAAELAEQTGHLGLLNMTQRAEAIGATLEIGRRAQGGTRVSLIWERATAPAGATAPAPA